MDNAKSRRNTIFESFLRKSIELKGSPFPEIPPALEIISKDFSVINLINGDSIHADFKNGELDKYVNISGAFAQPGNYGYTDDMSLGELINLAGGVIGRFPDNELILSRLQEDGKYKTFRIPLDDNISSFKLQISDYVRLSAREQDLEENTFSIIGAINNPGSYKYSTGMTIDDALKISGGILKEADFKRIEITRRKVKVSKSGFLELAYNTIYVSIDSSIFGSWDQEYDKSNFSHNRKNFQTMRNSSTLFALDRSNSKEQNVRRPSSLFPIVEKPPY